MDLVCHQARQRRPCTTVPLLEHEKEVLAGLQ